MCMKVLFFPYTSELGATQSSVKIAEILRKCGDEVIFAGEGPYCRFIESHGFKVVKVVEVDIDMHLRYIQNASMGFHNKQTIEQFIEDELRIIKEIEPDVVVDLFRPTLYISSKIAGIPRVSICNGILTRYYNMPLEIPETHWAHNIFATPGLHKLMYPTANLIKNISYKVWANPYNSVLEKYNLPRVKSILDLLEGDKTIVFDAKEFAPMLIPGDNSSVHILGPILHDITNKLPDWLIEIDEKKNVIYLSMGSTGSMLPNIIDDLVYLYGDNENYQVITNTLGLYPVNKNKLPRNFYIEDYLNANSILKKSNLFITHGGRGSIYHSLQNGVPIIGIPHQPEQEWNLNRLESLKLGKKLSKRNYNREDLKNAVEDLINNEEYKVNAKNFQVILNNYNGPEEAASVIKNVLNGKKKDKYRQPGV